MLFSRKIEGFASWETVFNDLSIWKALTKAIYAKEGIPMGRMQKLTPGTNAVFRVGDTVVKIFAPVEAMVSDSDDFQVELTAHTAAALVGVSVPKILAHGCYRDSYSFSYVIMEFIEADEIRTVLPKLSYQEQMDVLRQLKQTVDLLHSVPIDNNEQRIDHVLQRAINNKRWEIYNRQVSNEVQDILLQSFMGIQNLPLHRVHGDMTGENVLVSKSGKVFLIDFADSCIAPAKYEDVAILGGALSYNPDLCKRYFAYANPSEFVMQLFPYFLLHDFGAGYLRDIAFSMLNCKASDVQSLSELESALVKHLR